MRRWLTVLAACVAAAVIATLPEAAVMLLVHDSPRPATVITAVTIWLMWGALFGPAVYFGCRRAARMRGGVALIVAGSVPLLLAYRIASSAVASLLGGAAVTTFFQPVIVFVLTASYALLTVNEEQRIEAERRRADADLRFASARLERLRAELQPHFLFNAINTISALAAAEPDKAARVCGDLRDLFRATALDELPHVQPVEDELALTRKYLDVQQARFDERLRVHFDVDPSARELRIPALLLRRGECVRARNVGTERHRSDGHGQARRGRTLRIRRQQRARRLDADRRGHRAGQHACAPRGALRRRGVALREEAPGGRVRGRHPDPGRQRSDIMSDPRLRVLLVDDERPARLRLGALLAGDDRVAVIGEAADGAEAVETILSARPDLVLLDIEMPELDGFGVIAALPDDRIPLVVFVTAFDEYAVRAFDAHAVDYLTKPVSAERLREAITRAAQRRSAIETARERVTAAARDVNRRSATRLAVRAGDHTKILAVSSIDWVHAAGNYVEVFAGAERYLVRSSLSEMEEKLPTETFARIHRSVIVNVDRIVELRPGANRGDAVVMLESGRELPLSRSYRDRLSGRFDEL